jgi:hypothetical protein
MEKLLINRLKSEFSIIPENGLRTEILFKGKSTSLMKGISKIKKPNGMTYVTVILNEKKVISVKTNLISLITFLEKLDPIKELEVSFSFLGLTGLKSNFTIFQK